MENEFTTAGDFAVNPDTREVRGLLVPYGEASRLSVSGVPPIRFERGDVRVPRDVTVMNATDQHDRYKPVARFVGTEDTESGLVGVFAVSKNPDGDKFLADHKAGVKSKLSPELRNIQRYAADNEHGTADLTGAGFVTEGAFASAGMFAVDPAAAADAPVIETEPVALATKTVLDPDPATGTLAVEASAVPLAVDVTVQGAVSTFTPSTTEPTGDTEVTDAQAPVGAFAAHGKGKVPALVHAEPDSGDFAAGAIAIRTVAEALASASRLGGDPAALMALARDSVYATKGTEGMFALNDVKLHTASSVGLALTNPQWVGNLWARRRYNRRFIPLWSHGDLHSWKVQGWRPTTDPAMATWAGDKGNVPSNNPATESVALSAKPFAGGHDIAREFRDFDVPEFWEWYLNAMTDSYAKLTDIDAITDAIAGATAVTAGAVPSGVASGLVSIVDGALSIIDKNMPTFAVVATDVYRALLLAKDIDKLAFINQGLGLEEGTIASFRVVPYSGMTSGKVLVGASAALTTYELPGSPIRVEALDQIRGGIDDALFGYEVTAINDPGSLALVTPAA